MHTLSVTVAGLLLLGLFCGVGWAFAREQGARSAALVFVPVWFVATALNMWVGVNRAGYTVLQEMPVSVIMFVLPTAFALTLRARLR